MHARRHAAVVVFVDLDEHRIERVRQQTRRRDHEQERHGEAVALHRTT